MHFIEVLEDCLGKKAKKIYLPMQDGDVATAYANVDDLVRDFDFKPSTSIETGLENFVKWDLGYYR
jgi:UDP-glucuronate 4-epimerase